jgi:hypothetical protein
MACTGLNLCTRLVALTLAVVPLRADAELCEAVVAVITNQSGIGAVRPSPQRVEIRRCNPQGELGLLQIVAWNEGASHPSLLLPTDDVLVTQFVSIGNVVAIQSSHETTDVVRIITFRQREARLSFEENVKQKVTIRAEETAVTVSFVDNSGVQRSQRFSAQ